MVRSFCVCVCLSLAWVFSGRSLDYHDVSFCPSGHPPLTGRNGAHSFRTQVGVDATAARSCFLMLKIVLRTSGADVVFSGATRKVQALLRSHGVITDDDPVFNRYVCRVWRQIKSCGLAAC